MSVATSSSFFIERARKVTVICFTIPELTEDNHEEVSEELLELVSLLTSSQPIQVVVDLLAVKHMDDLGLAMLHALNDSIEDAGGTLVFCRPTAPAKQAIDEAGLSRRFLIYKTLSEATRFF